MKKRIIYSNYNLDEMYDDKKAFLMEEHPELCTCEVYHKDGTITFEPSDNQVWEQIYEDDRFYWKDAFDELKSYFKGKEVIMFGTIGRWNGNFAGGKIGDFENLFYEITRDCDYVEFRDEDGHLYLDCSHHDGTNCVSCKILSQKGVNFYENWCHNYSDERTEQEIHQIIINSNFLSKLPHYCKNVWGV